LGGFSYFSTRNISFIYEDRALVIIVENYIFIYIEYLGEGQMAMRRILHIISAKNAKTNVQYH